uniref:Uncharacterized protein n=1 Tax=Xanthomonas citri pv. phaseoli var. fuscans TaxID=473423 RepID=A0A808FCX7_XANCI
MDYRDPETARRRSIFHQRIQIGFPGRSFVVDLQSYFSSLLGRLPLISLPWQVRSTSTQQVRHGAVAQASQRVIAAALRGRENGLGWRFRWSPRPLHTAMGLHRQPPWRPLPPAAPAALHR